MSDKMRITLEMTLGEVNRVNELLSRHPFNEVSDLIMKMRGQAQQQFDLAQARGKKPNKTAP